MYQLPTASLRSRARPVFYGFLAGLVVGLILGWMMHGLIGLIFRIAIFAVAVLLVAAALVFWQNTRRPKAPSNAGPVDATWRDPRGGRGGAR